MRLLCFICLCLAPFLLSAQYISRSEPVPYDCPVVCAGSSFILKVPQVQNFSSGTQIQAQLSNATGSFNTGANILVTLRYSLNQGSSWNNGPFMFTNNVNDLFLEVQIPSAQLPGSNYTIRMRSASGYTSNDLFQCNGGNRITISPSYTPLPALGDTAWGINQWLAHAYTWTATVPQILNTPALIAQQNFFAPINYKGYFIKNALSFDQNYTTNGSKMPGPLNTLHDGTSFSCGEGYSVNYSVRFLRKQFFNPGKYLIEIAADDGIRLSIDGGQTWLLDAFIEQSYQASYKSTNTAFPGGICLNGELKLVVEYFQRPVDARVTVRITQLAEIAPELSHLTLCEGSNALFSAGNAVSGASYQWEFLTASNGAFSDVPSSTPFSGTQSNQLSVNPLHPDLNQSIFRCRIDGVCPNPVYTDTALLKVLKNAEISAQPVFARVCPQDSARFEIATDALDITWEISEDGGLSFSPLTEVAPYSGTRSSRLSIFPAQSISAGSLFRAKIIACAGIGFSDSVGVIEVEQVDDDVVPNVITPNGDGKNELFMFKEKGLVPLEMKVYNRWGNLVFDSGNTGSFEWNPNSGTVPAPAGLYYFRLRYQLECGGRQEDQNGTITVLY